MSMVIQPFDPGVDQSMTTTKSRKRRTATAVVTGKECRPFWSAVSQSWSLRLPSCSLLQDLAVWSSSAQRLALNSWFTVTMKDATTLQQYSSVTDAVLQKLAREEDKKTEAKEKREEAKRLKVVDEAKKKKEKKTYENPLRARRIRIQPDTKQKEGLNQWFGAVRFCYNKLVAAQKNVGQGGVNLASMTKVVKDASDEHTWLKDIPCDIKAVAVRDMDKARTAHFAKLKKKKENDPGARHDAKFKFRTKKDAQQSFEVRGRDMDRKSGAFAFINLAKIKASEKLPDKVETAVRFVKDRLGRYFIVIPIQVEKKSENKAPSTPESIVSLDPGVRTFQTTYDAAGMVTEWGKGDMSKIFLLCRRADKAQSSWQSKRGSKRRGAKRAWWRLLDKIKYKVKEIHRKMAVWLCENYKVILIPRFETSKMVRRAGRKIRSVTARQMMTWSHYGFRELLKTKAELYPWVNVIECEEPYTSKTCGCCGELNNTLGGSKIFKCAKCGYVADRDANGARNILLRYLTVSG